jgi:CMP-N,N'-diacetyllegionaminic acid synthase
MKDLTFVIAVRGGSKRVKNKNIRKFGNSSLLEIKLKQIIRVFGNQNIFLSSDCIKSLKIGKKYNVKIDFRPKKFASDKVPMKKVYQYLASKIKTKYICYLHVTSPFLKDKTLYDAVKLFFKNKKSKSLTLATVTKVKEYLWYKKKAFNYNPSNHPRSQTLPVYFALNFAVNIVDRDYMRLNGRIVSDKYIPVILKFPENIDIDEKWQFEYYRKIFKYFKIN